MLKKALLVGINAYSQAPLRGCVNDIMDMNAALRELYAFKAENLRVLQDQEATRQGIIDGLNWLAEGGGEEAVRVFHYAGHGHFVPDENGGDEPDGADEALVPYDCAKKGYLIDDHLKELYDRFPKNGNLTIIMDCCHSGTNQRDDTDLDIAYRFMPMTFEERKAIAAARRKFNEDQRAFIMQELQGMKSTMRGPDPEIEQQINAALKKFEKQCFGDVSIRMGNVLLAACQSDQKAADAKFSKTYHGAFTHTLVRLLRESAGQISYFDLIAQAGNELHDLKFTQIPQLECEDEKKGAAVFSLF
ncbi:MAG: caspase family protein [candidate division KSB1 bacterium]